MQDLFYLELDVVSLILYGLIFYNAVTLYQVDFSLPLSRLLISGAAACIFDIALCLVVDTPGYETVSYMLRGLYLVFLCLTCGVFCEFVTKSFYDLSRRKYLPYVIFYLPAAASFFLYFFKIPLQGGVQPDAYWMSSQFAVLGTVLLGMVIVMCVLSIVWLIKARLNSREYYEFAFDVLLFVIISAVLLFLQVSLFDIQYVCVSIALSIGLSFLSSRRNMHNILERKSKDAATKADLNTASNIQQSSLITVFPPYEHHPEIDLYAVMDPSKEIGGDFYDCFELDDTHVCFVIADVSGKGISGALFMMRAKTTIASYASKSNDTAEIFNLVNQALCQNNSEGMFATAWIGVLNLETMSLQYTNAGHEFPFLAHFNQDFEPVSTKHGLFLGGMETTKYKSDTITLSEGDTLFLYTDGLREAENTKSEQFSTERILDILNSANDRGGDALLSLLKEKCDEFTKGTEQFDDITMLVVNVLPKIHS